MLDPRGARRRLGTPRRPKRHLRRRRSSFRSGPPRLNADIIMSVAAGPGFSLDGCGPGRLSSSSAGRASLPADHHPRLALRGFRLLTPRSSGLAAVGAARSASSLPGCPGIFRGQRSHRPPSAGRRPKIDPFHRPRGRRPVRWHLPNSCQSPSALPTDLTSSSVSTRPPITAPASTSFSSSLIP